MKKIGIYSIHNTVNGKRYIGQSVNLCERNRRHFKKLRFGDHHNSHLQGSFLKYGEDSFEFSVLEETLPGMLDIREVEWIKYYRCNQRQFGYNHESGGSLNKKVSDETKLKISLALKGRPLSDETRRKMRESSRHIPMSVEHKAKLLKFSLGCKRTDEARERMSKSHIGKKIPFEVIQKRVATLKKNKLASKLVVGNNNNA